MGFIELFILAIGLSMDAFAVSICRGMQVKKANWKHSLEAGLYFGGFQALMPIIGYYVGASFYNLIKDFDHWVAFILLAIIGINMLREALSPDEVQMDKHSPKKQSMLLLAVATSIDALAVGVSLALLNMNIFVSATFIGVTTFWFSALGVRIGTSFGDRYKSKAEIVGGIILISLGIKILIEHLFT